MRLPGRSGSQADQAPRQIRAPGRSGPQADLLLTRASLALTSNIDDPTNLPLIERFGVLSFPVGKIFLALTGP